MTPIGNITKASLTFYLFTWDSNQSVASTSMAKMIADNSNAAFEVLGLKSFSRLSSDLFSMTSDLFNKKKAKWLKILFYELPWFSRNDSCDQVNKFRLEELLTTLVGFSSFDGIWEIAIENWMNFKNVHREILRGFWEFLKGWMVVENNWLRQLVSIYGYDFVWFRQRVQKAKIQWFIFGLLIQYQFSKFPLLNQNVFLCLHTSCRNSIN